MEFTGPTQTQGKGDIQGMCPWVHESWGPYQNSAYYRGLENKSKEIFHNGEKQMRNKGGKKNNKETFKRLSG